MRIVLSTAVLVLLCSAALAQEVEFTKQENKSGRALAFVKSENFKIQNTQKPEGVTAPEGELTWGKLVLGKKSYTACYTEKDRRLARLWVDIDNDKNLKEETPEELVNNMLAIDRITAELPFGVGTLEREIRVVFSYYTHRNGYVGVCEIHGAGGNRGQEIQY